MIIYLIDTSEYKIFKNHTYFFCSDIPPKSSHAKMAMCFFGHFPLFLF